MNREPILILDFGSQFSQLIARRVRESGVYALLVNPNIRVDEIRSMNPSGVIFSGGPSSVTDLEAPRCCSEILNMNIPILGICYGMQLLVDMLGGRVVQAGEREFGSSQIYHQGTESFFKKIPVDTTVWMSHGDQVEELPSSLESIAYT